jgi:hypothetical protein
MVTIGEHMSNQKNLNLIANGKGGIGKTFCAWNLTEYLMDKGRSVFAADTDPTNATFCSYKALGVKHIQISDSDMNVDKMKFDALMQDICMHKGDCVIDNGSGSFLPIMGFIKHNKVAEFFATQNYRTIIHTPIVAGQSMDDTVRGLQSILDFTNIQVVVWENEIEGPIVKNGFRFSESELYKQYRGRILGIIRLPQRTGEMAATLKQFTNTSRTYGEALDDDSVMLIQKHRMTMMRAEIFDQLDQIEL